jgi:hypothetical protein
LADPGLEELYLVLEGLDGVVVVRVLAHTPNSLHQQRDCSDEAKNIIFVVLQKLLKLSRK